MVLLLLLFQIRLMTSALSPAEAGRYYLLLNLQSFFSMIFVSGLTAYVNRHFVEFVHVGHGRTCVLGLLLYSLGLGLFSVPLVGMVIICGRLGFDLAGVPLLLAASMVALVVSSSFPLLLNLLEQRALSVLVALVSLATGTLLAWGAVSWGSPAGEFWLAGIVGGQLFVAFFSGWFLFHHILKGQKLIGLSEIRQAFRLRKKLAKFVQFAWPISLITGLHWLHSQGFRFPVNFTLGETALGLFLIGFSMGAQVIISSELILQQWLSPFVYRKSLDQTPSGTHRVWQQYSAVFCRFIIPVGCYALLAAPLLTSVVVAGEFQESAQFAVWGALAETMRALAGLYYGGALMQQNTRPVILPQLAAALIALLLVWIGAWAFGLTGLGAGLVISYIALLILYYLFVCRDLFALISVSNIKGALGKGLAPAAVLGLFYILGDISSALFAVIALIISGVLLAALLRRDVLLVHRQLRSEPSLA